MGAETIWVDPEVRSFAQQADAAVKLVQGNVLAPQSVQELYLGMNEKQRERDMAWREQNATIPGMAELFGGGQDPSEKLLNGIGGADNGRELRAPDFAG